MSVISGELLGLRRVNVLAGQFAFIQELCQGKVPYLDDNRVMLLAENEIIKNFLTTQAL